MKKILLSSQGDFFFDVMSYFYVRLKTHSNMADAPNGMIKCFEILGPFNSTKEK